MQATAKRTQRHALRVLCTTAPLALMVLVLWAFELLPDRPALMLMCFNFLLASSLGAGVVASLASMHLAIARAFTAGYMSGVRAAVYDDDDGNGSGPKHKGGRGLRAVE